MNFRALVTSLACFATSLGAVAQSQHDVVGIWQMVVLDNEGDFVYVPAFKEIRKDGSFVIFSQSKSTKPFRITQTGTYKMLNDSTMREHIDQTMHTRDLLNKDNDLTMKFNKDGSMLVCSYFIPGNPQKMQELWTRVMMPKIKAEDLPSNFSTM